MRTISWWGMSLVAASLAACAVESHQIPGRFEGKLEARQRLTDPGFTPIAGEDICADNGWYDDGECDFWCPAADADCDDPTNRVCAAYIEEGDGLCRRGAMDPCRNQDPDCDVGCPELPIFPGRDGVCSFDPNDPCTAQRDLDCDDGVACDAYLEMPDGTCSRPSSDKCRFQDPDCDDGGTIVCPAIMMFSDSVCTEDPSDPCVRASDPDCDHVTCTLIDRAPPIPDGVCNPPVDPCAPVDPDCDMCPSNGDAFFAPIPQPVPDGVCTEVTDPCAPTDPDCEIACAEFIEVADGTCSREATDVCRFQDPDCGAVCITPGAPPMADGVCVPTSDPCNIDPDCQTCAFFAPLPPPDGVCDGVPNDPCSFQGDQDCTVACAAFIEANDGQCERYSTDPCISQDPDCVVVDCALVDPNPTPDMICPFTRDASCRSADPDCKPVFAI